MRSIAATLFALVVVACTTASAQEPVAPSDQQQVPPAPAVVYVPVPYLVPYVVFVPAHRHHFATERPTVPPPPSQGIFVTTPATGMFAGNPATGIFVTPPKR